MLYSKEHKVVDIKTSSQKTLHWQYCRVSIASACRKIGQQWYANGILGNNRAMETDAQLAAIHIARNPWTVRPTGAWPTTAGPIAQRKDEIACADAVNAGRLSLINEIIEAFGPLANGPLTGFDNVSIADLVARGDQTYGTVVQTDIDKAKESVAQSIIAEIPLIEQFDSKMAIYRRLATAGYPTSDADMFRNARALCAAQPELNGYLMDYLRTHISPASQTWETLVLHVVQLAAVMGYTGTRQTRAASALDINHDGTPDKPTLAVAGNAVTLESITAENKKLRQEFEDFKKGMPSKKKLRQSKYGGSTVVSNSSLSSNCKLLKANQLNTCTETSVNSFTLPNLSNLTKPILDSGCSDTAFRQSDIDSTLTRQPKQRLILKTASGQLIKPIAHVIDSHGPVTSTTHIFDDKDLQMSLKSVADFTNNDCTVTFNANGYEIKHDPTNTVINSGIKDPASRVCTFSASTNCPIPTASVAVRNVLDLEYVKYYHAIFGSPPDSTFARCCSQSYFGNLPRLTPKMIRQNPPNSIATSDGHLNRMRQHIRSTSKIQHSNIPSDDILATLPLKDLRMLGRQAHLSVRSKREQLEQLLKLRRNYQLSDKTPDSPEDAETSWDDTIYSRLIDLNSDNEIHSDATGRFPFESARGTNYVLVFVYKGYIHVQPLTDRSAVSHVKAYRLAIEFFKTKGHVIDIARLDNETSVQLETFLRDASVPFQYVPPEDHRSNRAERAIQSFKNHFISVLATIDDTFPMAHWDELLLQTELTLSFLRPFAGNTKISSYQGIHGVPYDWLAHPMAPAGTKVKIYDSAESRESWQPHSSDGWYLGPALNHYRSYNVIRKDSMRTSVSNSLDWFPARVSIPGSSKEEILLKAIENLQLKIETSSPMNSEQLQHSTDAINNMRQLFINDAPSVPTQPDSDQNIQIAKEQRVTDTVEKQRVTDTVEEQRVTVIDESDTNEPAPATEHPTRSMKKQRKKLRKQKAKETSAYRQLTAQESKIHSQRLDYIGREWTDTESNQVFKIDDVVMPSNLSGPGSRTAYFKSFDVTQMNRPTADREYEHTACHEILTAKYVQWFVPGYAHTILSAEPRDDSEPPMNLDNNNKPLKYKFALISKNKSLLGKCGY